MIRWWYDTFDDDDFSVIISNIIIIIRFRLWMEAQAVKQYKTFLNLTNCLMSVQTNLKRNNLVKPICHNSDGAKATLLSY